MPDIKVGEHIDRDCKSDPAQRKRKVGRPQKKKERENGVSVKWIATQLLLTPQVFTNKCSKGGCKQKEMIRVTCDQCRLNYCLKHRHPLDHDCKTDSKPVSKSGLERPFSFHTAMLSLLEDSSNGGVCFADMLL